MVLSLSLSLSLSLAIPSVSFGRFVLRSHRLLKPRGRIPNPQSSIQSHSTLFPHPGIAHSFLLRSLLSSSSSFLFSFRFLKFCACANLLACGITNYLALASSSVLPFKRFCRFHSLECRAGDANRAILVAVASILAFLLSSF